MTVQTSEKTAEQLVKEKYPAAFVEDDGEGIYIMLKKTVTEPCPTCQQAWTHQQVDLQRGAIARGNTASAAWENAARNLRLL